MAILYSLAGLDTHLLIAVYLIKYSPPGHLSELCVEQILSAPRFHNWLCFLFVFVLHVIDFFCTESTCPSQVFSLNCNHLWGIRMRILSGQWMENFCWLPVNSHLPANWHLWINISITKWHFNLQQFMRTPDANSVLLIITFLMMPADSNTHCVRYNWFSPDSFMNQKSWPNFLSRIRFLSPIGRTLMLFKSLISTPTWRSMFESYSRFLSHLFPHQTRLFSHQIRVMHITTGTCLTLV